MRHIDDICREPMGNGHTKTHYTRHSIDELRSLVERLEKRGRVVANWVLSAREMLARVNKKGGLKRASVHVSMDDVYVKVLYWMRLEALCCNRRNAHSVKLGTAISNLNERNTKRQEMV